MSDISFSSFQHKLAYRALAIKCKQASAGGFRIAPVRQALAHLALLSHCSTTGFGKHTIDLFTIGRTESVCPVHARSAFLANIQSNEPSKWTTARELEEDLGDMSAVRGVGEAILW